MILFVAAFRLGGRLSVIYPVYATTFIWATVIAVFVDHEPISWAQAVGIGVIVGGVILVTTAAPQR